MSALLLAFGNSPFPQPDLITNGTFGSDTGWTKPGSNPWTISGGKAHHATGDAASLQQSIAFVAGGVYRVTWTLSNHVANVFQIRFSGTGSNATGTNRTSNGTYVEDITAVSGNNTFNVVAFTNAVGSVDNISMQRIA